MRILAISKAGKTWWGGSKMADKFSKNMQSFSNNGTYCVYQIHELWNPVIYLSKKCIALYISFLYSTEPRLRNNWANLWSNWPRVSSSERIWSKSLFLFQWVQFLVKIDNFRPLRSAWEVMKSQTETSGLAHLKSAHQLSAELSKINEISEQSREKRRLKEESVR